MITVSDIQDNLNTYIGDSSTDRISAVQRLQYITEGTVWLQEILQNDAQNATYDLNYYDTVNYYKITTSVADMLEGADLRRVKDKQTLSFEHKSSRELAEDIGQQFPGNSWSVERRNGETYLAINHQIETKSVVLDNCQTIGNWMAANDAYNLTVDTTEYKEGSGSFKFDVNVLLSGTANSASLINGLWDAGDLSKYEIDGSILLWIYIADSTFTTSVSLVWGSDSSNFWTVAVTTPLNKTTFEDGWNRVKFDWATATKTLSPDASSVSYIYISLNYSASQTDMTGVRIDNIIISKPEKLTFYYLSWNVGKDAAGSSLTAFSATTDIPYFSGTYDQYKYSVAHMAASLVYGSFRLPNEAQEELISAERALQHVKGVIPSQKNPETKNFKVGGINLTKNRRH